ncbi:MAG TPA: hypothetical protein K8U95_07570 [Pseudomonas nitrititolerans]|nr:hypothetical protein [Stutzerimonas nitrititolerans]
MDSRATRSRTQSGAAFMKVKPILTFALSLGMLSSAHAGIYADDLSRCLVGATTSTDKTELIRWVFATASEHPSVSDISSVTSAQREQMDYSIAMLFERLLTGDCLEQTQNALQYEGVSAMQKGFEVLGQVAMTGLMSDSKVSQAFSRFGKHLDASKFETLIRRN